MKKCLMMKKLRSEDERKERHGLHSDLVADILTRLDAKTLSNCKRVCKTWYQIISDPSFIAGRRKFMLRISNLLFVDSWDAGVCTFSICDHNMINREEGDYVFTSISSTSGRDSLSNALFSPLLAICCVILVLIAGVFTSTILEPARYIHCRRALVLMAWPHMDMRLP